MTQDDKRVNFLLALDRSDEVTLSGFELDFVASNLDRFNFSPKQRVIIDKLMAKYEVAIGWNPDNTRLAERQIAEQAKWSVPRDRFAAKAPRPTIKQAGRFGYKEFADQLPSFVARARPARKTEHCKEKVQRVNGTLKLSHSPVKVGTVVRNGARMEDWWIDYATGTFKDCPFLAIGDEVEYDFYPNPHG